MVQFNQNRAHTRISKPRIELNKCNKSRLLALNYKKKQNNLASRCSSENLKRFENLYMARNNVDRETSRKLGKPRQDL